MKVCTYCEIEKSIEDFYWKQKDIKRSAICKKCQNQLGKNWYNKNKDNVKERTGNNQKKYFQENQEFIIKYFEQNHCIDCGERDIRCLDFDHLRDKKTNVCGMIRSSTLKQLKLEIEKCVVRCANCHRKKTCDELGYWRSAHVV